MFRFFSNKFEFVSAVSSYMSVSTADGGGALEKYYIICKPELGTLNRKEEIFNSRRHRTQLLLDNTEFLSGPEKYPMLITDYVLL